MTRLLAVLAIASAVAVVLYSQGEQHSKWLAIAASQQELVPVLDTARKLQSQWPHVAVVASNECEGLRPGLFLAAAAIADSRGEADSALQRLKAEIPDAYVRQCRVQPESTLAAGVPLVDPSIFNVPSDSVNWSDRDRVSRVIPLGDGSFVWIRRWYSPDPNDPLEGRRESVLYFERKPEKAKELQSNCTDAHAIRSGHFLVLSCARENAGDNLLHEVLVFDTNSAAAIKSIPRCREPIFASTTHIKCKAESVGAQGKLKLEPKEVPLT